MHDTPGSAGSDAGYGDASTCPETGLSRKNLRAHKVDAMQPSDDDALLTPSEVAAMFRVNPKTVTRWARAGKISAIRTLGGHRRFRASEIRQFLEQVEDPERI
jgi:excisionase family DNA binding protein